MHTSPVFQLVSLLGWAALVVGAPAAIAQPQVELFPDLSSNRLLVELQRAYTPVGPLDYGIARDTLFAKVWARNGRLEAQYSGYQIDLPSGVDPTNWAFDRNINTEHVYPQSKGADSGNARADMHHLYPTRENVNADRGSLPFADIPDNSTTAWYLLDRTESRTPSAATRDRYSEGTSAAFEPREQLKGDVARAMFYFRTIYRSRTIDAAPNFFGDQVETLCRWHEQDPVDDAERLRNTLIERSQGNANPFILDCTLPDRLRYCPNRSVACQTLDAEEALASHQRLVYPNPTTGRFFVDGPHEQLTLSDARGRVVWRATAGQTADSYQLPALAAGLYFLQIQPNSEIQKIILE